LPPGASLKPIGLTNNAVFEVRVPRAAGARFALRVHRPRFRTPAQTRSELRFLEALDEELRGTGTKVPRPVPARDGELVVEVGLPDRGGRTTASRHCDLLTWVEGRVFRPSRGLGQRGVHAIGEALGRLHNFAERFQPPPGFELPRWDADAMFTEASPFRPGRLDAVMSPDDWRLFQHVAERTRATFDALDRAGAPQGIVHFDFILLNCHLVRRRRGWEVGVIDFDDLGWGYFLYDLCPLLDNLADYPHYRAMRRAFLDGYRSVRPLPHALEAHVPILMAARHAAACAWVLGVQGTSEAAPPAAEHIAIRMELIRERLALRG
jgi:Ser/Thr protein kinase RdoA (MazF antagonist)